MAVTAVTPTYVKQARDARRVAYLKVEADLLVVAAHPGVVELIRSHEVEDGVWELELRLVQGDNLTVGPSWSAEEVAGFGAAAATTLADLHDLGIAHGRLGPDHLLVDEAGRPLLCGLGGARRGVPVGTGVDPRPLDVSALARCLIELLPPNAPRDLRRALDRAISARRRRPLTARQLARSLSHAVPGSRLPGVGHPGAVASPGAVAKQPAEPASRGRQGEALRRTDGDGASGEGGDDGAAPALSRSPQPAESSIPPAGLRSGAFQADRRSRSWHGSGVTAHPGTRKAVGSTTAVILAALVVVALGIGLWLVSVRPPGGGRARSVLPAAPHLAAPGRGSGSPVSGASPKPAVRVGQRGATCPPADRGCGPVRRPGGVLTTASGRYRFGAAGDVVVLGRWTCRAEAFPALLRPTTGQVWVFDAWAAGRARVGAHLVATIRGGRSLRVMPDAGGCDRLSVLRAGGPAVIVDPRQS
jgi:eukaryotic-like serine/threonine-protein kinase